MNKYKTIFCCFIVINILLSCSIRNRSTKSSIFKTINASSEIVEGNIVFENDYVQIKFNKGDVLKALSTIRKLTWITKCDQIKLHEIESKIINAKTQTRIFDGIGSNNILPDIEGRILEELIFKYHFVVFNKLTNQFEKEITYSKRGGDWGCCFAGFSFLNREKFVETRVFTDLIIIEDCDTIPYK